MATIKVNGKVTTVEAPDETPLLWVLREELGLTGTKFGCGQGLCGACTVHLDGAAIRACLTPVGAAVGHDVTTIEGLLPPGKTHALAEAWVEHDVVQCGYCQPGQVMAAAALLARNKAPTDADIDSAMAGNICRCGTYPRVRAAVHSAAKRLGGR